MLTEAEASLNCFVTTEPFSNPCHLAYVSETDLYVRSAKGYAVAKLVKALRYKPEGRGFDPAGGMDVCVVYVVQ